MIFGEGEAGKNFAAAFATPPALARFYAMYHALLVCHYALYGLCIAIDIFKKHMKAFLKRHFLKQERRERKRKTLTHTHFHSKASGVVVFAWHLACMGAGKGILRWNPAHENVALKKSDDIHMAEDTSPLHNPNVPVCCLSMPAYL